MESTTESTDTPPAPWAGILRWSYTLPVAVLSLLILLGRLDSTSCTHGILPLYDWLPLHPMHGLVRWLNPEAVIDGETAYDVLMGDVLLFWGAIFIVPWTWLCRRWCWVGLLVIALTLIP